jgi:hypothetical protein
MSDNESVHSSKRFEVAALRFGDIAARALRGDALAR